MGKMGRPYSENMRVILLSRFRSRHFQEVLAENMEYLELDAGLFSPQIVVVLRTMHN